MVRRVWLLGLVLAVLVSGCVSPARMVRDVGNEGEDVGRGRVVIAIRKPGGIAPMAISPLASHIRVRLWRPGGENEVRELVIPTKPGEESVAEIEVASGNGWRLDVVSHTDGRVFNLGRVDNVYVPRGDVAVVRVVLEKPNAVWTVPGEVFAGDSYHVEAVFDGPPIWTSAEVRRVAAWGAPGDVWEESEPADVDGNRVRYDGAAEESDAGATVYHEVRLVADAAYNVGGLVPLVLSLPHDTANQGLGGVLVRRSYGSVVIEIE